MSKVYKLLIIGGGASGLACAAYLALNGEKDVAIIERLNRVGKKLLATGNGQGNVSNKNLSLNNYHGGDSAFASCLLEGFNYSSAVEFFSSLGVTLKAKEDGRAYPQSMQASTVLDAMRAAISFGGIETFVNSRVVKIVKKDVFTVTTEDGKTFFAKNVLLATGGSVAKQFGTDGTAYDLAKAFNHRVTKTYPALVQIKTKTDKIKALKGLKTDAFVYAYDNDKIVAKSFGEVLFTDYGVSGPAVFQVSGFLATAKEPKIKLSFLPNLNDDELKNIIKNNKTLPFIGKSEVLNGLLNKHIAAAILNTAKSLSEDDIVFAVRNFTLSVTGNTGPNNAQVTKGGIATKDVESKTFESKLVKGLYFAGEILDIDGDCGGYNLHFAFGSGITVAKRIIKNAD